MERYWCLRLLLQDELQMVSASVVKESLVVTDHMPLFVRVPSLPALDRGVHVSIGIESVDLLNADIHARYLELLASSPPDSVLDVTETEMGAE